MKNGNGKGKINIKSKKNIITKKNIIITISIIVIALITIFLSVSYMFNRVDKRIDEKVKYATNDAQASMAISKVAPSLVTIGDNYESLASKEYNKNNSTGIIVDSGGLIVTSYEKVKNYNEIFVDIPVKGLKPTKGYLLGYDKKADIALIKISASGLTPIKFANSEDIKEGSSVYAIGNSISSNYIGIITPGIITSTNHKIEVGGEDYQIIQTNAVMNDENFGGVLCNSKGELVGVNSKYLTNIHEDGNLYFASSVDAMKKSLSEIIKKEDIIGIRGVEVTVDNEYKKGFYIKDVVANSKAQKGGLKPTDIILTANSTPILSYDDLMKVLKENKNNKKINLEILRNGEVEKITINL